MKDPIVFEGTKRGGRYVIVDPTVPGFAEALLERLGIPVADEPIFDVDAAVSAFYDRLNEGQDHRSALWSVLESLTDDPGRQYEWEDELREAITNLPGAFLWSFHVDPGGRPMGNSPTVFEAVEFEGTRWVARRPDRDLDEIGYDFLWPAPDDFAGLRAAGVGAILRTFGGPVPDRIRFGSFMRPGDITTAIGEALTDDGWERLRDLVSSETGVDWPTEAEADRLALLNAYLGVAMGRPY
jgi:hypothetical protein